MGVHTSLDTSKAEELLRPHCTQPHYLLYSNEQPQRKPWQSVSCARLQETAGIFTFEIG